jgi:hypothetical protein
MGDNLMGRKRLPPEEKRVGIKLSIKKKYVDELKVKKVNISLLFEEFVKKFLNM